MKSTSKTILILLALAVLPVAFAQSNREHRHDRYRERSNDGGGTDHVPGPTDYDAFSGFISERNIFDPNRVPHYSGAPRPISQRVRSDAPFLSLVGIMS